MDSSIGRLAVLHLSPPPPTSAASATTAEKLTSGSCGDSVSDTKKEDEDSGNLACRWQQLLSAGLDSEEAQAEILGIYGKLRRRRNTEQLRSRLLRDLLGARPPLNAFMVAMDILGLEGDDDVGIMIAGAAAAGIAEIWKNEPLAYGKGRELFHSVEAPAVRSALLSAFLLNPNPELGADFSAAFHGSRDPVFRANLLGNIGRTGSLTDTLEVVRTLCSEPRSARGDDLGHFACVDSLAVLAAKSSDYKDDVVHAALELAGSDALRPQTFERVTRLVSSVDPSSIKALRQVAERRGKGYLRALEIGLSTAPSPLGPALK
ncbi:MAG: hypothetical protein JNJ88_16500 [Planctomycetes bacterium]|nr:hypothetical protein [Planctomycetota bacterium]